MGSDASAWFTVKVERRRGYVISPCLFNFYMDEVVREVNASVIGLGLELLCKWVELAVEKVTVFV